MSDFAESSTNLTLFGYWRSSSSYRVRIALELKGIEYRSIFVNLAKGEQTEAAYKHNVNIAGLVPVLDVRKHANDVEPEFRLTQSLAIIDFLDTSYPGKKSDKHKDPNGLFGGNLLPLNAADRAQALEIAYTIACDTSPLQNLKVLKRFSPEDEAPRAILAKEVIENGLTTVESILSKRRAAAEAKGLPVPLCCVGSSVTIADACLVPQVYNAIRWGVDMARFPCINAVVDLLNQHDAFIAAHPDNQPDKPK